MKTTGSILCLAAAVAFLVWLPEKAHGCVAITKDGLVGINNETVIILWDKAHKTEHFIRSVTLNSTAGKAGFLVPTPTTPELAVADPQILNLPDKYLPIPRTLSVILAKAVSPENTEGTEPRVVAEKQIGDYYAVVLDASDTKGLGKWLKQNGYPWSKGAAEWLAPYLSAKWKITAFKLQRSGSGMISTEAIRMSFTTTRPFFPYREPEEASKLGGQQRVLRIAFLGDERVVGKLGDGTAWPAHLDFAGSTIPAANKQIDPNDWLKYAGLSSHPEIKLPAQLTYFSDYSNPRPGKSDLYFTANPDQSNYSP